MFNVISLGRSQTYHRALTHKHSHLWAISSSQLIQTACHWTTGEKWNAREKTHTSTEDWLRTCLLWGDNAYRCVPSFIMFHGKESSRLNSIYVQKCRKQEMRGFCTWHSGFLKYDLRLSGTKRLTYKKKESIKLWKLICLINVLCSYQLAQIELNP